MESVELCFDLMSCSRVEDWRKQIFKQGNALGYERSLLAIFPDHDTPITLQLAFLHTNFSPEWVCRYDNEKMGEIDPVVFHCATKSTPLVIKPGIYSSRKQKGLYEEACKYGMRSGVALPIHGFNGQLGILCFASDGKPDEDFELDTMRSLPELSYFRDLVFETSQQFIKQPNYVAQEIALTPREVECLKWSVTGKSSWAIGQILHCTEAAVNFHFANIRRKFSTTSRRQALIKAIRMGIITP